MHTRRNHILKLGIVIALWCGGSSAGLAQGMGGAQPGATPVREPIKLMVAAQPIAAALNAFARQSGLHVVIDSELARGLTSAPVEGVLTPDAALTLLLANTGLRYEYLDARTVAILASVTTSSREQSRATAKQYAQAGTASQGGAIQLAQATTASAASDRDEEAEAPVLEELRGIPEILVMGSRSLNMDITRTRDDAQPYVVFDRKLIDRAGATSVEQLLQQRLPMNTSVTSMGGAASSYNPASSGINLRGLGPGQTLILVDGHRLSGPSVRGDSAQSDISGIPLAAVERIEILPSTASGIYGGNATGGVINIITRKDFSGGEVRLNYDNTFSADSTIRKVDFVFGENFNEERTNILLSAGYSDASSLTEADRGFIKRSREHMRRQNPQYYNFLASIPAGRRPNFASVDGSDLVLRSGQALNSPIASVPVGYGGVATDGGLALVANAGRHDWELPDGGMGLDRVLYTEPMLKTAGAVLRHRFSDGLQAFVDVSASESERRNLEAAVGGIPFVLQPDSPHNPFTTAIRGTAAFPEQATNETTTQRERAVAGVIKQLPADWQMSLDYTWDRTRMDFTMTSELRGLAREISAGGVDILRDLQAFPFDVAAPAAIVASMESTLKSPNVRFSGPLGDLPGGRPVLSFALGHREESAPDAWWLLPDFGDTMLYPARSTSVSSAYLEYRVPLFSHLNARPGLQELELQLAVRGEEYTSKSAGTQLFIGDPPSPLPEPTRTRNDFSSVDPTIALRWKPIEDLAFRMSYGTGFLAPALGQLVPVYGGVVVGSWLTDPLRGNSSVGEFEEYYGGNPDLRPEQSESWSAGLVLTPRFAPGLRLSLDYTLIEKSDNIGAIPGAYFQGVIDHEARFPDRVVRGPKLPGDPADWAGPIVEIDMGPVNLASLELEVWDVQLDYRWDTATRGVFELFLVGTWQPRFATRLMSGEPSVDYVGVGSQNPLEFKANAGLAWSGSAWRMGWNVNYFDSYQVVDTGVLNAEMIVANQGNGGRVSSQIYHDVYFSYDVSMSSAPTIPEWFGRTQVQAGVRNVFDKRPPVDMAAMYGHAYYSPFGSPRMASYYLTVTTRF